MNPIIKKENTILKNSELVLLLSMEVQQRVVQLNRLKRKESRQRRKGNKLTRTFLHILGWEFIRNS